MTMAMLLAERLEDLPGTDEMCAMICLMVRCSLVDIERLERPGCVLNDSSERKPIKGSGS